MVFRSWILDIWCLFICFGYFVVRCFWYLDLSYIYFWLYFRFFHFFILCFWCLALVFSFLFLGFWILEFWISFVVLSFGFSVSGIWSLDFGCLSLGEGCFGGLIFHFALFVLDLYFLEDHNRDDDKIGEKDQNGDRTKMGTDQTLYED